MSKSSEATHLRAVIVAGDVARVRSLPGIYIAWNRFQTGDALNAAISLPREIDDKREQFRNRYINWIQQLGGDLGLHTISEELQGLADAWMASVPLDYSLASDSFAYRVIRLWALEEVWEKFAFPEIEVINLHGRELETLEQWANARKIRFVSTTKFRRSSLVSINSQALVSAARAVGSRIVRYSPAGRQKSSTFEKTRTLVVDYFDNLDPGALSESIYFSRYWGQLSLAFQEMPDLTWLHFRVETDLLPNARVARHAARTMTISGKGPEHRIFEDAFSLGAFFKSCWQYVVSWYPMFQMMQRLGDMPVMPELTLGAAFRFDLAQSLLGAPRMNFILSRIGMSEWAARMPNLERVIYLMEGQPWELALLRAIEAQAPESIGYAHAGVLYWDFRYAAPRMNPRCSNANEFSQIPNRIAVNSEVDRNMMCENGYPLERIKVVEAVRFESHHVDAPEDGEESVERKRVLLVIGDYDESTDQILRNIAYQVSDELETIQSVVWRPHPSCRLRIPLADRRFEISRESSLQQDIARSQYVLASSTTSTSLILQHADVTTFLLHTGENLAFPPVAPSARLHLVHSAADIRKRIMEDEPVDHRHSNRDSCLYDQELKQWRALIT